MKKSTDHRTLSAISLKLLVISCSLLVISCLLLPTQVLSQAVVSNNPGATPDASAMLDVQGTGFGVLIPRMTTSQRDGILFPASSLLIFNTTSGCFETNISGIWVTFSCPSPCTPTPPIPALGPANYIVTCEGANIFFAVPGFDQSLGFYLDISTDNTFTNPNAFARRTDNFEIYHDYYIGRPTNCSCGAVYQIGYEFWFQVTGLPPGYHGYYRVRSGYSNTCLSGYPPNPTFDPLYHDYTHAYFNINTQSIADVPPTFNLTSSCNYILISNISFQFAHPAQWGYSIGTDRNGDPNARHVDVSQTQIYVDKDESDNSLQYQTTYDVYVWGINCSDCGGGNTQSGHSTIYTQLDVWGQTLNLGTNCNGDGQGITQGTASGNVTFSWSDVSGADNYSYNYSYYDQSYNLISGFGVVTYTAGPPFSISVSTNNPPYPDCILIGTPIWFNVTVFGDPLDQNTICSGSVNPYTVGQ
jgi:hypothetical protein